MNGVAYAELGEVDKNLIDTRPIFVMPRVNFAYDVKGDGDLIVRGGAGVFYNRPMGNAEYDVIKYLALRLQHHHGRGRHAELPRRADGLQHDGPGGPVRLRGRHRGAAVRLRRVRRVPALLHDQPLGGQAPPVAAVPRGRVRRHVRPPPPEQPQRQHHPGGGADRAFPDPVQRAALDGRRHHGATASTRPSAASASGSTTRRPTTTRCRPRSAGRRAGASSTSRPTPSRRCSG